jgi:pSer/pThr/pTyr-binding forkhead associated (FHA) protein
MRDHDDTIAGSLWADGDMMFRIAGTGAAPDRMVKVPRPFALIGRGDHADILLNDRAVSTHHAYLHLDPRGVYAVDLITRTGTRINGTSSMVGWLRPGDSLEIAGRRVELVRIRHNGAVVDPPLCHDDLLADTEDDALARVTLEPHRASQSPWVLGSELVFLGGSASCGIQVKDTAVARTHCALVRAGTGAYLVDLCGRQTWIEDKPVEGAGVLHDGDMLTLGSTRFTVRVEPPAPTITQPEPGTLLARRNPPAPPLPAFGAAPFPLALNPDLIPAEAQSALVAWMMGTIQGGQGELLRRQGEFQRAITQILNQIQHDNARLLNAHLQRIESIDRELVSLRAEIERRNAATPVPARMPPPPSAPPLRIARPTSPPPQHHLPDEPQGTTTWLLQRVNQLEDENRSAWKDLLARLSQSRRAT